MSVAKISLMIGILVGLVIGILMAIVSSSANAEVLATLPAVYSMMLGWKAIIIGPIFYGVLYFISGLIGALIYNLFAKLVGGIKIELVDRKKK